MGWDGNPRKRIHGMEGCITSSKFLCLEYAAEILVLREDEMREGNQFQFRIYK